jgi:glycine/D-amino acid oxidase-like deaminating enzyme
MSQTERSIRRIGMDISQLPEPTSSRFDVVVVGGGLAGLTAAAVAARAGATTVLIEPHGLGGRGKTDARDGYLLNRGAHALYRKGHGMDVLRRLGVVPKGHQPSTAKAMGLRDGTLLPLPLGTAALTTRLLSVKGKARMARVLPHIGRLNPTDFADRTVDDWLAELDLPADADTLLRTVLRTGSYTEAFDQLSADVAIMQNQAASEGVLYLDGGWAQMVDALANVGRGHGVEMVKETARIVEADSSGGGVVVRCRDRDVRAGAVVLATGSPLAAQALIPDSVLGLPERIVEARASCLDVALRRVPDHRFVLGVGRPLYCINHAPPASLAPEGGAVLHAMRYLGADEFLDPETSRAELQSLVEAVGVRTDDVVYDRYLHNMTAVSMITTPGTGGLAGRPSVAVSAAPGVFLAGDWVGAEGWLVDASLASGERAAHLAARFSATMNG